MSKPVTVAILVGVAVLLGGVIFAVSGGGGADRKASIGTGITVTIVKATGQADPATLAPIKFAVTFSTPVSGFATGDVTIAGTAFSATDRKVVTVSGSGASYAVAVQGMTRSGTVIASIPANAVTEGNAASTSPDNNVQLNLRTVAITKAAGQADPASAAPIKFKVTFSAPVSGFTTGDVTITGTAFPAGATKTVAVSGSGAAYTMDVSGMANSGTVIASIRANVVNGGNAAATSPDNNVQYDVATNDAATIPSVILLDKDGDGLNTSGVTDTALLTGARVSSHWTVAASDDAFVAIDASRLPAGFRLATSDGTPIEGVVLARGEVRLTSPSGDTASPAGGWELLRALDTNGDGRLDAADAPFDSLRLFTDANGDGTMNSTEVQSFAAVRSIGLTGIAGETTDSDGNVHRQGAWSTADGTGRRADSVQFAVAG